MGGPSVFTLFMSDAGHQSPLMSQFAVNAGGLSGHSYREILGGGPSPVAPSSGLTLG